jgi:hypothetical protein
MRANTRSRRAVASPSRVVVVVCWAQALAGCAAGFATSPVQQMATPPSVRALLTAPAKPDCTFHEIALGDTWPDPAETAWHKLEYERRCYREAEMRVRARLRRLQASVAKGMKPAATARCGVFRLPCKTPAAERALPIHAN